jgi:hypothetical protein
MPSEGLRAAEYPAVHLNSGPLSSCCGSLHMEDRRGAKVLVGELLLIGPWHGATVTDPVLDNTVLAQ